jgi:hypothetical protein
LRSQFLFLIPFILGLAFMLGCGSGAEDESAGTPTPKPLPDDATAIRAVDFEQAPDTQSLLQQLGTGRVAVDAVLFADITGDQREEAIVPVTSDGTLGNIAYLVLTLDSGAPRSILTRTMDRTTASGLVMEIEHGTLTETAGVYGAEDPFCCPSELRTTTFRWDGSQLQVEREETAKSESPPKR